ncbi:MAG: sortase [bacterium]
MAKQDLNDDELVLKRRKELKLKPLNTDTPAASINISASAEDLEILRNKISSMGDSVSIQDKNHNSTLIIPAHQDESNLSDSTNLSSESKGKNAALNLVRTKLASLYTKEPDALKEAEESFQAGTSRSKHQDYMYQLTMSGKGLADIQTQWHTYYASLPDAEKHEVWNEFYKANQHQTPVKHRQDINTNATAHHKNTTLHQAQKTDTRTVADIKNQVISKISAGGKLKAKHHIQSLLFGIGMASLFAFVLLFSFFNERFIAPFVSPSKSVTATPIVGSNTAISDEPKIIIPKINLEVPVVFDLNTTDEKSVQNGLEKGVVHYSTSPFPGQTGNIVIVGHSSNNILNKGKYKFAFVLLKRLEIGDTFSIQKDSVRYTYQVFEKKIVKPTDVSVLGTSTKPNTATLITCDPPGTSLNRLVVTAEQISPDPSGNKVTEQITPELSNTGIIPSNAPSLWQRFKSIF